MRTKNTPDHAARRRRELRCLLAGVIGTVCMDTARYVMYRRAGGKDGPLAWEFAPIETWEQAPDPGRVAKRGHRRGFTQRELPDRWAWPVSTIARTGATDRRGRHSTACWPGPCSHAAHALYGLPFGTAVWSSGYLVLPEAGLYKPIWEYDAKTPLAKDLAGHLAYGARYRRCLPGAA